MSELTDLRAALADISGKTDTVAAAVAAVAVEVQDLITRLSQLPPITGLHDAITAAAEISTKLAAVSDALKAIPPEPPA